ncbi:MAG: GTP-binding protein [Promethearchaeota archaeon]
MLKFTFKFVLLGDQAVGKTSLVLRYINDTFNSNYISTIGADFLIKELELFGAPVRLMIWDLGGQRKWEAIRARYMAGSDGCILIFDVSQEININYYIYNWIKEIHDFVGKNTPLIIVGNKIDLKPKINLKETSQLIQQMNRNYIETSAKTGEHVETMFLRITADVIKQKALYIKKLKGIQETDISTIFNKLREKS